MIEIYLAPGLFLVSLFAEPFNLYGTDARTIAYIVSFFAWIWLLQIIAGLIRMILKTKGNSRGGGPTIEKSLGWLSVMIGAICAVLAAPFLYAWFSDPLFQLLTQSMNGTVARGLSWFVIGLATLAVHFFIQSSVHGFLFHAYIKRLSS